MADVLENLRAEPMPPRMLEDEERILRYWTPILLRTILIAATIILVVGLVVMAGQVPGAYIARFRAVLAGHVYAREPLLAMLSQAVHGDPHAIVTIGLMVLTLVPLARVAFCFLLFIREHDWTYVVVTAYVLSGLLVGVILGRVG